MLRPDAAAFLFLAPGLLHQLGNLLLTVHGTALTIDAANLENSRRVLLTANDRGTASVHLVRILLGEPVSGSGDAAVLLEQIAELCRVPLRERGQAMEVRRPLPTGLRVDNQPFVWGAVEAVRLLSGAVPAGVGGGLEVALRRDGGSAWFEVRVRPVLGALPFPIPAAEVADRLEGALAGLGVASGATADGMGVALRLVGTPAVRTAEP